MYKMKQYKRALIATMALLLTTIGAWADGNVVVIQQLDGVTSNESLGTVSSSISGTTCTLTVTPNSSYYTQGVTAVKTIGSGQVRTRTPEGDASQITVTAADPSADISGATNWTLTMPQSPYDVEVTVNFSSRTSIAGAVLTLNPTSFSYDGKAKEPAITKISDQKGTELKLTAGTDYTIAYSNNTNVPGANDPQPTVTITGINRYTGAASATFTIAKADITPTVSITGWTYGATANTPTVSGNTDNGTVTYTYAAQGTETFSKTVPTAAGNYTVKATIAETANYNGAEATADFTISKAAPTVTAPTAIADITYTGNAQALVNAGTTSAGTLQYKLGANGTYSTSIPTGTDAGEYEVYYIVVGDNNHSDVTETGPINVTIAKAGITPTVTIQGWSYGATTNAPTVSGNTGNGTVTYTYAAQGTETFSETVPTAAGEYTVKATIAETTNYNGAEATADFTISKATPTVTAPTAIADITYTGNAQALVNAGTTSAGTLQYKLGANGTYSTSIPTGTDAGEYEVYYIVVGDNNHSDVTETEPINVTISKAAGSISFAETTVSKTFGDNAFTKEATNTGDGAVSYSSSATNVATVDAGTGLVTIVGAGEATITATVTDGTNYNYATKTASYTLNVATDAMEVSATGYDGTYDGQAHTITVNAPQGATVMYGTTEGTYNLQAAPTYTDAGNYTVYYQVTMKNFTTVTGSKTVTIAKANATITKAPEAIAELKDTGKEQVLITAGEAEGGEMVYSTDGTNYSAELPTATAEGTYTIYYKVAGDANHNDTEVQTLSVTIATGIKTYALWINDTQVTEKNVNDVLGDDFTNGGGSFQYFPEKNVLFVIANNTGANILSRIPEGLTVYLFATTENSLGSISGIGTLTITTDGNFPGLLNLNAGGNVISGFTSLVLGENLGILAPEDISYENGVLPTLNATIGVSLIPIAEMKDENMADMGENPDGTEIDLSNYIFDDRVLFTLKRTQSDDGDGATEDGGIIISTPLTLSQLNELAGKGVATIPPGTDEFAECFTGITILVPAGEGVIEIDGLTMDGYIMGVRSLFSNELIELRQSKDEKREKMLFEYKFDQPTFVGIYNNGRSSSAASARAIQRAKKKVGSVTIYGISIKPRKISTANSASAASGGSYTPPNDGNPDNPGNLPPVGQNPLEPDIISGIRNVQTTVITDGKWYNLNGQQIDEPKQKGLYIHNGKKILIK